MKKSRGFEIPGLEETSIKEELWIIEKRRFQYRNGDFDFNNLTETSISIGFKLASFVFLLSGILEQEGLRHKKGKKDFEC
jgi:hypothetical protein